MSEQKKIDTTKLKINYPDNLLQNIQPRFGGEHFDNGDQMNPEKDSELLYVPMSFGLVTSAQNEKPKIGTSSLASCAGICIYDPETKVGGVAHVFFNEKTSYTYYLRDSSGREIASSAKTIVRDDPYWFRRFEYLLNHLVRKAQELGAKKFEFHGFNVLQGVRTPKQNEQLAKFAQELVARLTQEGVFVGEPDWKEWQGFTLDTRNGQITPSV
jgi:chemotaxis receptor (MCP) glutamine deamidase CheD